MKHSKLIIAISLLASCSSLSKQVDDKHNIKLVWRNQNFDWITSSIFMDDKSIYFGSFDDSFYAANLTDGKIKLSFKTNYDPYFLPILNCNRIYFTSFDLNIYCIDTLANLVWKIQTVDRVKNNLLQDDSLLFVSIRSDGIKAIRKINGATKWHLSQNSQSLSTNQPIIFQDKIYVGLWDLNNKLLAVDKKSGKVIWSSTYPNFSTSDPALTPNGLVVSNNRYYNGGQVTLLDYDSGKEIWTIPLKCESLLKPFTDDSNIIISTYDNKIVCLDLNGKVKWTINLETNENAATRICAFKHNIYFGTTNRNLYCVNIETGKPIFTEPFNYGISEPIVTNDKIYFPTGGGELWTLKE